MTRPSIILIGAGGHAHACIDVIERDGRYQIGGLIASPDELHVLHFGYPIVGCDDDLPGLAKTFPNALIAVGQIKTSEHRERLYARVRELGFQLPTIVAPSAQVSSHASVGSGTIVMHGAIVNAGAKVGFNCIINTRAVLEHDVSVGDNCHISTGAIVNGNVRIGSGSFVGSGSLIKEGLELGRACIVGMGLTVRHSLLENSRFTGNKS